MLLDIRPLSLAAALVVTGGLQLPGRKRPFLFSQPLSPGAATVVTVVRTTVLLEPYLEFAQQLFERLLPPARLPLPRSRCFFLCLFPLR